MLFLGNSYTFQGELDQVVAELFAAADMEVAAQRLAQPGWSFVDHVEAVETDGSAHALAFAEPHDWVILQEQSQIPGFPEGQSDFEASRDGAVTLDGHAADSGAQTMFLMTWGRRAGDSTNLDIFPDYPTMQAALAEGYTTYVAEASADGTQAWIAPAGLAWQAVYEDVIAGGGDPTDPTSTFGGLYVDDGSHPSARGTYLAACVIYASITGDSPEGLGAPEEVADATYLQGIAAEVVLSGQGFEYPWETTDPIDTGDTGDSETGDSETGEPDKTDGADTATTATNGCGCVSGRGSAWWMGMGALFLGRRRRWPTPREDSTSSGRGDPPARRTEA